MQSLILGGRASTCLESIPSLISLTATNRLTGSVCLARQTEPMPPSPIASMSLYLPAITVPTYSSTPGKAAVEGPLGPKVAVGRSVAGDGTRNPFAPACAALGRA